MPRKQSMGLSRLILVSVWRLSVCAGMGILVAYETQPGEAASSGYEAIVQSGSRAVELLSRQIATEIQAIKSPLETRGSD